MLGNPALSHRAASGGCQVGLQPGPGPGQYQYLDTRGAYQLGKVPKSLFMKESGDRRQLI